MSDTIWTVDAKAIEAGARVINREMGCRGGATFAECVYMIVDGNCECARVAQMVISAALNSQFDGGHK